MITQETMNRINAVVQSCIKKILGQSFELQVPVTFRTDMKRTAGLAYSRSKKIELNQQLFLANTDEFFSRTIPHEAAHIITYILYPNAKQGHGPEWRNVMNRLNVEDIKRCHSYDVSALVKPRFSERFTYVCACDRKLSLTKIMHNKIQKGSHRRCNVCNTRVHHEEN